MMNTKELIEAVKNERGSAFQNCRDCEYGTHNEEVIEKLNRLAELEDKIEQGTLIELPCVRQRKGYLKQYEAVYEKSGVIQECIVGSVIEGWKIIEYHGDERCKAEAEKRLKELQNG